MESVEWLKIFKDKIAGIDEYHQKKQSGLLKINRFLPKLQIDSDIAFSSFCKSKNLQMGEESIRINTRIILDIYSSTPKTMMKLMI